MRKISAVAFLLSEVVLQFMTKTDGKGEYNNENETHGTGLFSRI